jgi:hypothetical protein
MEASRMVRDYRSHRSEDHGNYHNRYKEPFEVHDVAKTARRDVAPAVPIPLGLGKLVLVRHTGSIPEW